jgi:membrane-bound metal-dependent hydrolase YbcI (DUF457 family)
MHKIGMYFADAGLGVMSAVFVCLAFGVTPTGGLVLLGILFAYIPDVDWVLDAHFWKTGRVAAYAQNPYDHREGLHKPLLWALAISGAGIIFGGIGPFIAFTAVMAHFLHDTVGTGWGMPWLWPLTKRRIKFCSTKQNELKLTPFLMSWSHEELSQYITNYGRANWKDYYYGRWTAVATGEALVALTGAVLLVVVFVI